MDDSQQLAKYLELIQTLLTCESGTEATVYQQYARLVDENLPKVMIIVAEHYERAEEPQEMGWLRREAEILTGKIEMWNELNAQVVALYHQGAMATAIPLAEQALAVAEDVFPSPNNDLAASLNNLAGLYESQGRWAEAEPLYDRALQIREELFGVTGHPDLVNAYISLALSYAQQQQPAKALPLFQQAIEVGNKLLANILAASDRQRRLQDLERFYPHLEYLLSLTQQYFADEPIAVTAAFNAVLSRKAKATATEASLSQAMHQQPELAAELQQLKSYQKDISALSYQIANQPELKHRLSDLLRRRKDLERKLGSSIPAIKLAQQVVDRQALTGLLPDDAFLVEFVRYDPFDFIDRQWQPARYLAFVVRADNAGVTAIDCGAAAELDLAIDKFRRAHADHHFSGESSGSGDMFRSTTPTVTPNHRQVLPELLDRLLPHLPPTGTCYLASDSHFQVLPFHLLKTEGEYLGDRYRLHHLTTARDLLRHELETSTNDPMIFADPDYDGGMTSTARSVHPKTGLQLSDRLDGKPFERLPINRLLGESISKAYGVPYYNDLAATVDRLERLNAPRLLVVATHGFTIPALTDLIVTLQKCPEAEEEGILRDRSSEITPEFRAFWQQQADKGNEWCQSILTKIDRISLEPQHQDRLAQSAADPMLRSGIALAGANIWRFQGQEDPEFGKGVVFADDITQWNLWGNELSILITCVSGLGEVSSNEGVFGLRRALAIAGAKYVISSLWNIPTKPSVLLMNKFFEFYQSADRPTPTVALAAAQTYLRNITLGELRKTSIGQEIIAELQDDLVRALSPTAPDDTKPLADPYFWGAWICQG